MRPWPTPAPSAAPRSWRNGRPPAYIIGPILGALAAAFSYRALELDPKDRLEQAPIDTLD